ncbi:c-type cytochrome [Paucibacter soli]|uniref:c-type cytochrome n=1 Tax=Paucibacter soli TaxID=3133433 RepID=UPI0030AB60FD
MQGAKHRSSLWLLSLLLLSQAAWAQDKQLTRAEEIVQGKCFICHGVDGESSSPVFPRLAGQHGAYVARQLADYQAGRRKSSTMQPMVEDLNAEDFAALGRYFESRQPLAHAVDDSELAQVGRFVFLRGNPYSGVAACAGCHGPKGHGTPQLPRLAGQHAQYTENQLRLFSRRERSNDNAVMHAIASKLSELELKAVSVYISGLN